jgi:hypothetical protein
MTCLPPRNESWTGKTTLQHQVFGRLASDVHRQSGPRARRLISGGLWRTRMFTVPGLANVLLDATKRYAISDPDVQNIEQEIFAILRAISPGCGADLRTSGDARHATTSRADPPDALSRALDLFHRLTDEPRQPELSAIATQVSPDTAGSHSRRAMRLAYCVKILAEAAPGNETPGTDERTFAREIHPPRHAPASTAPLPYQQGEIANAIPGSDLESVARDIENEIRELDRLG